MLQSKPQALGLKQIYRLIPFYSVARTVEWCMLLYSVEPTNGIKLILLLVNGIIKNTETRRFLFFNSTLFEITIQGDYSESNTARALFPMKRPGT